MNQLPSQKCFAKKTNLMSPKPSFQALINGSQPVLVDFYADWCGPCKMMAPELEKFAGLMGEKVKVIKIDVDKNPALASTYRVQGVPTLILFREGQKLWQQAGAMGSGQLQKIVEGYL
jgi:thioredoxin 1